MDTENTLLSPKQMQFVLESNAKWNLAHGSVRSGKTYGTLWAFLHAVDRTNHTQIYMIGYSQDTIYQNVIRLIMESEQLAMFKPFCTWAPGRRVLKYRNRDIATLGAKDEGAIGAIQGKTFGLAYCDEMTLYPENVIDMIDTRLSYKTSQGFASMNPGHPEHKIKKWIDMAEKGDKNYYALHFTLDDNPYVDDDYKERIKNSVSGLFYKRNYLGLWVQAEGAIYDFFDRNIHVLKRPPRAAEYWIAGIDYGQVNAFTCVLIGVSTGRMDRLGKCLWVEKEYYWDPKKQSRQKTTSEFAQDVRSFLEPYAVKAIYLDPSAEAMHVELKKMGIRVVHANNDVANGIQYVGSEMAKGNLFIVDECKNCIREIEGYVWDSKAAMRGEDAPLKKNDHTCDAIRYAVYTHRVSAHVNDDSYGRTLGFGAGRSIF